MTTCTDATRAACKTRKSRGLGAAIASLFDTVAAWRERRRQRLSLGTLDDSMLRDIGLSRADVEVEIEKPFWMV